MARYFPPSVIFFLLLYFGLLALFRERAFYDPGSLWHIRVGEIILAGGFAWSDPTSWTDPFTYTFAGHTWIPQQWGMEVLIALAHRLSGLDALLLAFASGVAGLYAWLFARLTHSGMQPLFAGIVVAGFLAAGAFHYYVRPHMVTVAFLAITIAWLVDWGNGRLGIARIAWLIPLDILWTNMHGGVLGGLFTFGLAILGWTVQLVVRLIKNSTCDIVNNAGSDHNRSTALRSVGTLAALLAIFFACCLTPLINPYGLEMIRTWRKLIGSPVLAEVVSEHKPLSLANAPDQVIAAFGIVYLILLAGALPRLRVTWLIPLAWLALSFQSIRQGPLFAITALVALADFWPQTRWYQWLKAHGQSLVSEPCRPLPAANPRALLVPTLVLATTLAIQILNIPFPLIGRGWARLDPRMTPIDLNPVMQSYAQSVPPGTPIFNDANLGGYLIYFTPQLKIFMDDRCELYGDDWISHYSHVMASPPDQLGKTLEEWYERYRFDRALIMTARPGMETPSVERYLLGSPLWREAARGQSAVLFERVK